ncbi:hypothetical protein ACWCPF_13650 [Streptomyces sp. NPDC001858]
MSDLDQRMLLHDVADRLNAVADHLPLPDQIHPGPALSEILDDEIRHLARLLGYLAGESAFRHRAARYPHRHTATDRRTTLALASAAEPAGAALAALGAAVHQLGLHAHLTDEPSTPARARSTAAAHQQLVDRLGDARAHLAHTAKQLRASADTQARAAVTVPRPPAASSAASRHR